MLLDRDDLSFLVEVILLRHQVAPSGNAECSILRHLEFLPVGHTHLWGPYRCRIVDDGSGYCFVGDGNDLLLFTPGAAGKCLENIVSLLDFTPGNVDMFTKLQEIVKSHSENLRMFCCWNSVVFNSDVKFSVDFFGPGREKGSR